MKHVEAFKDWWKKPGWPEPDDVEEEIAFEAFLAGWHAANMERDE